MPQSPINSPVSHIRQRLISIDFRNYKALSGFQLNVHRCNVLVGPNNHGKSTIIGAIRILAAALRRAHSKSPEWVRFGDERRIGYEVASESIPISLENVHTDYSSDDTTVTFNFSDGASLTLYFPKDGGCRLIPTPIGNVIRSPAAFREAFPFKIAAIPVLGPLEHREALLRKDTVQQNLLTHRASRHFRNYWHHFPDGFDDFAALVRSTWPGMNIRRPFSENLDPIELYMFAEEDRISRELYWCGFGFQIWCQLLTHISRNRDADLLVVDEPEVYLHPDVQRQLLGVLNDAGPSIVLATHSTEIMAEAEPSEIVLIDKERGSGRRLQNASALQAAFAHIGSVHSLTLAQASRNKRIAYVDDARSFGLLKRFAHRAGYSELSATTSITPLPSGGIRGWGEIRTAAKRISEATDGKFRIAVVYGSDYRTEHELREIQASLSQCVSVAIVLQSIELENYLLVPDVLDRVVAAHLIAAGRPALEPQSIGSITILEEITRGQKDEVRSRCLAGWTGPIDSPSEGVKPREGFDDWFEVVWADFPTRMRIVRGRSVLSTFRACINDRHAISFSDGAVADAFDRHELPIDLIDLLAQMNAFACQ